MKNALSITTRLLIGGVFFLIAFGALQDHMLSVFAVSIFVVGLSTANAGKFTDIVKLNYYYVLLFAAVISALLIEYLLDGSVA
tara:strand:+ start:1727 stop:1975 length:249 start_codon:yes stop_codon:yes gene_type:complete